MQNLKNDKMKLTVMQWVTIVAILAYLVYEFYFVAQWEKSLPEGDPVIRADLPFIWGILLILIVISVFQFIRKRKR